jgi:hypothetical protein
MRREGVRAKYQRLCRHALYAGGCRTSKPSLSREQPRRTRACRSRFPRPQHNRTAGTVAACCATAACWVAALAYFDEIMEAGVEVWRYNEGFIHQKAVLVDELISSIGTTNLDNRSCRLNFEATLVVFDKKVAAQSEAMFEADFARSFRLDRTLDQREFSERNGAPLSRLFSPLL